MSLFNFEKRGISNPKEEEILNPISEDIIKEQDQEFGSLPPDKIFAAKKWLIELAKGSSDKPISEEVKVIKESEEEKNEKIRKTKESMGL